ncbi:efflux RND transporter periplasmic adaptor subunit [Candidatus Gracilibacteria bacterium]|nr:efflux RND transporter periplasmic adaptor subunit [Candidatus Gracilibacteria bacterium]
MSLVNEAQKHHSGNKWFRGGIILIIFVILGYSGYAFFFAESSSKTLVEKKLYTVTNKDLRTSIESDGKVTLQSEIHLDFVNPGIIREIFKKEGDLVVSGEIIASLDASYLDLAIEKAEIALKIAESNYSLKERGGSVGDIEISKKQVESSQASYQSTLSQSEMDIKSAEDAYKIARDALETAKKQAKINEINASNTIDTNELDVKTAESNLTLVTSQEEEKYKNIQNKLLMDIGKRITPIEDEFSDIDILFGISDENKNLNDYFESQLGMKDNMATKLQTVEYYKKARTEYDSLSKDWKIYRQNTNLNELETYGIRLKNLESDLNKMYRYALETLENSITSSSLQQDTVDLYTSKFEKASTRIQSENSEFSLLLQSTQEAKTSMNLKINSAKDALLSAKQKKKLGESAKEKVILENEIAITTATQKLELAKTAQTNASIKKSTSLSKEKSQIEISKSLLESKQGSDSLELEPLTLAVLSAQKNLEEANKKKEDSFLKSPLDGTIVNITGSIGESSSSLKEPFVTVINSENFTIESEVAEEDIIKIKVGQLTYITFDAIEGLTLTGEVTYTSNKATIDANGVVSYKTLVRFTTKDSRIREGMSSTVEFVTKEAKNALVVPVQAVKTINKKPSVLTESGVYQNVVTGFTDLKLVEILSGVKKGDIIVY